MVTDNTSCAASATSMPRWWRNCASRSQLRCLIERLTEAFAKLKAGYELLQRGGEWGEVKKYSGRARRPPRIIRQDVDDCTPDNAGDH